MSEGPMGCVTFHNLPDRLLELYRKKMLRWDSPAGPLELSIPADVFSSYQVDRGTRELLRRVAASGPRWQRALDLGCGYGPIALHLARSGAARQVDAVDRDALAVAFTRHNARLNGLDGVAARGALAYEGAGQAAYDAILCNLPAKAGQPVHRMVLLGGADSLRQGGEVWVVAVAALERQIDAILSDPAVVMRHKDRCKEHLVYRYAFTGRPADLPQDPYLRGRQTFRWHDQEYPLDVLHGLGEFDSRNWSTDLVLQAFEELSRAQRPVAMAIFSPSQGHLAVLACHLAGGLANLAVTSRDLIALEATRRNLAGFGYAGGLQLIHTADFSVGDDVPALQWALAVLEEQEGLEVNIHKLHALLAGRQGCRVIAGCRAAFGSRLETGLRRLGLRASIRKKRRGFCALYVE